MHSYSGAHCSLRQSGRRSCLAFHSSASGSGLRLSLAGSPMHQAVSCSSWFCLWTGSSPPVALHPALSGDAVTFDYGQPVLCPVRTFTPLLVSTLRRTMAVSHRPPRHALLDRRILAETYSC